MPGGRDVATLRIRFLSALYEAVQMRSVPSFATFFVLALLETDVWFPLATWSDCQVLWTFRKSGITLRRRRGWRLGNSFSLHRGPWCCATGLTGDFGTLVCHMLQSPSRITADRSDKVRNASAEPDVEAPDVQCALLPIVVLHPPNPWATVEDRAETSGSEVGSCRRFFLRRVQSSSFARLVAGKYDLPVRPVVLRRTNEES